MRLIQKLWIVALLLLSLSMWSCDTIDPVVEGESPDFTCEGCHTSSTTLKHVIESLDLEPDEGDHEAPG